MHTTSKPKILHFHAVFGENGQILRGLKQDVEFILLGLSAALLLELLSYWEFFVCEFILCGLSAAVLLELSSYWKFFV